MKIIFDNIVFSLQKAGGISVVWYELLKRISQNKTIKSEYIEYNGSNNIFRKKLFIDIKQIQFRNRFALILKRYFDVSYKEKEPFLFHSSYYRICSNKKAINITTIHDFTYEYFAPYFKRLIHCWQKYRAIRKSNYIICISENTKKDLLRFVPGVDKKKVSVIYNGVSEEYFPISSDNFLNSLIPFTPYTFVLFVGSREKYKNFELSVKAVAASNLNLVIVGSALNKKEIDFLNSIIGDKRYYCKHGIPNSELNNLYNQAFCLLYPSIYEGFGIPVIESQKAGCPVIAFDSSSIPEIIGDRTLLLQELTVEAIIEKFKIIEDSDTRKEIRDKGFENAKRFSWDLTTQSVFELYKKALSIS